LWFSIKYLYKFCKNQIDFNNQFNNINCNQWLFKFLDNFLVSFGIKLVWLMFQYNLTFLIFEDSLVWESNYKFDWILWSPEYLSHDQPKWLDPVICATAAGGESCDYNRSISVTWSINSLKTIHRVKFFAWQGSQSMWKPEFTELLGSTHVTLVRQGCMGSVLSMGFGLKCLENSKI